jgi:hypothetical protein
VATGEQPFDSVHEDVTRRMAEVCTLRCLSFDTLQTLNLAAIRAPRAERRGNASSKRFVANTAGSGSRLLEQAARCVAQPPVPVSGSVAALPREYRAHLPLERKIAMGSTCCIVLQLVSQSLINHSIDCKNRTVGTGLSTSTRYCFPSWTSATTSFVSN